VLDLRLIRSDTEGVRAALARRNAAGSLDAIVELDEQRRSLQTAADELRAERNRASQAIGEAKRAGRDATEEQAQAAGLGTRLAALDEQLGDVGAKLDSLLLELPNIPHPSAADGMTEEDAVTVAMGGEKPEFDFEPRDHLALALHLPPRRPRPASPRPRAVLAREALGPGLPADDAAGARSRAGPRRNRLLPCGPRAGLLARPRP
jgi:seryl-tRNA synthetase